jgi:DNA-binding NarL/FixJ family response regulator
VVNVLVVDDFAPWREFVLEKLRENRNLRVVGVVSDGLDAVLQAEALQPQLILLDIGLPMLDGIAAARQIRKLAPGTKILFLTQELDLDVARAALREGGRGYVVKTDAESELLAAVEAVLSGKMYVSHTLAGGAFADIGDPTPSDPSQRQEPFQAIPVLSAKNGRCHHAHFYRDDDAFLEGLTTFISAALQAGNAAIVVATPSHRHELFQRLQAGDFDIRALTNQGRYVPLDAAEALATYMVNGLPDRARMFKVANDLIAKASRAVVGDNPRVAVCGECPSLLWAGGNADAAIQIEHLWNEIAGTCAVDLLCGYVMNQFQRVPDRLIYERICTEHSAVRSQWAGY